MIRAVDDWSLGKSPPALFVRAIAGARGTTALPTGLTACVVSGTWGGATLAVGGDTAGTWAGFLGMIGV